MSSEYRALRKKAGKEGDQRGRHTCPLLHLKLMTGGAHREALFGGDPVALAGDRRGPRGQLTEGRLVPSEAWRGFCPTQWRSWAVP